MLCRCVFALWWSFFVWSIWHHLKPAELHIWSIDRHTTSVFDVSLTMTPVRFANVSVLWLNTMSDRVHLDLVEDNAMGPVSIKQATMNVYDCAFDDKMMEVYPINIDSVDIDQAHLQIHQDDSHYSPFRTIVIEPAIKWVLGGADIQNQERVGHIKDGRWYEGEDPLNMFIGVLFAWCMELIFLVIMRHPNSPMFIIRGRQNRVFK